jgi:hypothetical protein
LLGVDAAPVLELAACEVVVGAAVVVAFVVVGAVLVVGVVIVASYCEHVVVFTTVAAVPVFPTMSLSARSQPVAIDVNCPWKKVVCPAYAAYGAICPVHVPKAVIIVSTLGSSII